MPLDWHCADIEMSPEVPIGMSLRASWDVVEMPLGCHSGAIEMPLQYHWEAADLQLRCSLGCRWETDRVADGMLGRHWDVIGLPWSKQTKEGKAEI